MSRKKKLKIWLPLLVPSFHLAFLYIPASHSFLQCIGSYNLLHCSLDFHWTYVDLNYSFFNSVTDELAWMHNCFPFLNTKLSLSSLGDYFLFCPVSWFIYTYFLCSFYTDVIFCAVYLQCWNNKFFSCCLTSFSCVC